MDEIIGERGKETKSYLFQSHPHLLPSHKILTKNKGKGCFSSSLLLTLYPFSASQLLISMLSFLEPLIQGMKIIICGLMLGHPLLNSAPKVWARLVLAPTAGVFIPESPS